MEDSKKGGVYITASANYGIAEIEAEFVEADIATGGDKVVSSRGFY